MKKSLLVGALCTAAVAIAPVTVHAATVSISNTGAWSLNKIVLKSGGSSSKLKVKNNNNVTTVVVTGQTAVSGNAKVKGNTTGGDAKSGNADNLNDLIGEVTIENVAPESCGCEGGADVDASIDTTGKKSANIIVVGGSGHGGTKVTNNNTVGVENATEQAAVSGNAKVSWNTTGGDATSGDATNDNLTDLVVGIANDNSGAANCGCQGGNVSATIDTTGPGSYNQILVGGGNGGGTKITNNNTVSILNSTSQTAVSGNAKVSGNTTGGSATSGNASNTNSTSFSIGVVNQ